MRFLSRLQSKLTPHPSPLSPLLTSSDWKATLEKLKNGQM